MSEQSNSSPVIVRSSAFILSILSVAAAGLAAVAAFTAGEENIIGEADRRERQLVAEVERLSKRVMSIAREYDAASEDARQLREAQYKHTRELVDLGAQVDRALDTAVKAEAEAKAYRAALRRAAQEAEGLCYEATRQQLRAEAAEALLVGLGQCDCEAGRAARAASQCKRAAALADGRVNAVACSCPACART